MRDEMLGCHRRILMVAVNVTKHRQIDPRAEVLTFTA